MNAKRVSDALSELDPQYVQEALQYKGRSKALRWRKWGAAAACLVVVAALVLGGTSIFARESLPQLEPAAPAADAPDGMRKMMNYNGNRYVFLEDGAAYSLSAQQLKAALGTLDYDIQADPQANGKKEFSTTFALGGTVYELADYDPAFRLAVEWEGNYYLCQRTGQTDNSPMDAAEYFAAARFPERIERVSIADHAGAEVLAEFPGGEISALIGALAQAQPAALAEEDYLAIASAQTEGESYQLLLELNDGTTSSLYVLPSLQIAMIGDNRYALPDSFSEKFGDLFDGLTQGPLPAQ